MRLNVIRHGMTKANESRLYCGFTDLPLSEKGKDGLLSLRNTLVYPKAALYITSGLTRACETMRVLYDRERDLIIEDFKELNFGDFEMKSYNELKDKPEYQNWIDIGNDAACPNGESRNAFEKRICNGIEKVIRLGAESAVIVCHGGVIAVMMEKLFPGRRNFYEWQPGYGRGYTFDVYFGYADLISGI